VTLCVGAETVTGVARKTKGRPSAGLPHPGMWSRDRYGSAGPAVYQITAAISMTTTAVRLLGWHGLASCALRVGSRDRQAVSPAPLGVATRCDAQ